MQAARMLRGEIAMLIRVLCVVLLLATPAAAAAQGPLLWELQQDFNGGLDEVRALTLSGRSLIAVGNAGVPMDGTDDNDEVIQAVARPTGAVQWSDRTFLSRGSVDEVLVASSQHRAYVLATLNPPGDVRNAYLIRAFDVPTGGLLWQDISFPSDQVDGGRVTSLVATASRVVATGYAVNASNDGLAAVIRAHDALTGAVLWEVRDDRPGMDVIPWTVTANQRRVVVSGSIGPQNAHDLFVRSYDAVSGELEWELTRQAVTPIKIALASGRVIVAGLVSVTSGTQSYLAAASAKNGSVLWEDTAPIAGVLRDFVVTGDRIFGVINGGFNTTIRAYNPATGNIVWEAQPPITRGMAGSFLAIGNRNGQVFVAGQFGSNFPGGGSSIWVQAYDAVAGSLLWDDRSHQGVQAGAFDLVVGPRRVFVAGYAQSGSSWDWVIRAYDARSDASPLIP